MLANAGEYDTSISIIIADIATVKGQMVVKKEQRAVATVVHLISPY